MRGLKSARRSQGNSHGRSMIEQLESRQLLTVLTFVPATGAFANYSVLSQNYGDRVTAASQGGFAYGAAGGFTPHVLANYGTAGATVETWAAGYGNLKNVVFSAPNLSKFQMGLAADPGYNVTLNSFDMAAYGAAAYTINSVSVVDNKGTVLFKQTNVKINGGASNTHFSFAKPLQGQGLQILFDSSNQGGWNVGISNVQFGQVVTIPMNSSISGRVFADSNGNGIRDPHEAGLGLITVYLDLNNDGKFDAGDKSVTTDVLGNWSFTRLAAGTYSVHVVPVAGLTFTKPTNGILSIKLLANQASANNLFGEEAIN